MGYLIVFFIVLACMIAIVLFDKSIAEDELVKDIEDGIVECVITDENGYVKEVVYKK